MKNSANCPTCFEHQSIKHWLSRFKAIEASIHEGKKLNKSQKNWLWNNKRRMKEGKLHEGQLYQLKN